MQVIQNQNNQNPLVMGKPTFARFFAQIVNSSAGETSLTPWPVAYLYGDKDGVPLPGSPLLPVQAPPVRSRPSLRNTLHDHFLFH